MAATYSLDRGFTMRRLFNAPPDVVFEAWTDPRYLHWFFNPAMVADAPVSVDLRVGGEWRQLMVIDAATRYFTGGVYREIVPGRKLVFTWGAVGGWPALDLDNLDDAPLVTLEFTAVGEQTMMLFRLQLPDHFTDEQTHGWMNSGMLDGWGQTIDRLVAVYARRAE